MWCNIPVYNIPSESNIKTCISLHKEKAELYPMPDCLDTEV